MGYSDDGSIQEDDSSKDSGGFKEKIQRQFVEANHHLHELQDIVAELGKNQSKSQKKISSSDEDFLKYKEHVSGVISKLNILD